MSSETDSADAARNFSGPQKKRVKKNHLGIEIKQRILNSYYREIEKDPDMTSKSVMQLVGNELGVSDRSVHAVVTEFKRTNTLSAPKTNQNRKKAVELVDQQDKNTIRQMVHQFYFRGELPKLDKILQMCNDDPELPNFKRTTFSKVLKDLNFRGARGGKTSMIVDTSEIVLWRRQYLTRIKGYRKENRKIYYLDETWIDDASDNGRKISISHIGSVDGFVPGALLTYTFEMKNKKQEADAKSFENWFVTVLPKLEDNSIIVMDSEPHHCRRVEKIPNSSTPKADIKTWLHSKNIPFPDDQDIIKVELLEIVKTHKKTYDKYIAEVMAQDQNKTVLRIPPYHSSVLNPIELVWGDVKNYYLASQHNTMSLTFPDIKMVVEEAVASVSPEKWKICIEHVEQKVEQDLWELDDIIDSHTEKDCSVELPFEEVNIKVEEVNMSSSE